MKDIISVVNRKGGVGKTATAQAIGAGFTRRGYKTLFIDLDSQVNLSYDVGAKIGAITALEVLTGTATAEEAIQHTDQGDIIPGSPNLAGADTMITETGREYRLTEALKPLSRKYDYIVIDTPPALGVLTINALTASHSVIIPVQAEVHSLQGIQLLNDTIQPVRTYTNRKLKVKGILITRYNGRAILSRDMRENLEGVAKSLGTKVFSTPIRECISIKEAQALQQDIYTYAPKSNATADYNALLDELEKER